jgi:hypothetical protein
VTVDGEFHHRIARTRGAVEHVGGKRDSRRVGAGGDRMKARRLRGSKRLQLGGAVAGKQQFGSVRLTASNNRHDDRGESFATPSRTGARDGDSGAAEIAPE